MGALLSGYSLWSLAGQVVTLGLTILALANRKLVLATLHTLPRDLKGLYRFIHVQLALQYYKRNNSTAAKVFERIVKKYPDKVLIYFNDEEWTSTRINKLSNQIANYFYTKGLRKGDAVSLFMENQPEHICIWLGLSKIGVITGLINYNLRLQSLQHCINAVSSKAVIYNPELSSALEDVRNIGGLAGIDFYCFGDDQPSKLRSVNIQSILKSVSEENPTLAQPIGFQDSLFYIFTSGTTGLPKAAIIKHARFMMASIGNFYMHEIRCDDILYTCLPLYHGSAAMLGGGQILMYGVSMVIRKKFSASNFWKDCARYNVTTAQYIGEICRYLINQPESPQDRQHKVRVMFGNGLRAEIWERFVKRFNISHISELYGATEGNCNMVNIDDKIGAVGFIPRYAKFILPYELIKVDESTGEPIRNPKNGFIITCGVNEPGELIGRIEKNHPIRDFEGYADKSLSKSKVLENVLKKGDLWFRSGDIMEMDIQGYYYFKDRKGDTFRWKGENCSTAEVESIISSECGMKDAVVYGVEIPGSEGRAGMAAIADPENSLDLHNVAACLAKSLPTYARPMFIRILPEIDRTGTYKLKKYDLQGEGFNITKIKDNIYFLQQGKYVLVDQLLYSQLISGEMRL